MSSHPVQLSESTGHAGLTATSAQYTQPQADHRAGGIDYSGHTYQLHPGTGAFLAPEHPGYDSVQHGYNHYAAPGAYGQTQRADILVNSMPTHLGNEPLFPFALADAEGFVLTDGSGQTRGWFVNNQFIPATPARLAPPFGGFDSAGSPSQFPGTPAQRYGYLSPAYPSSSTIRQWDSPVLPLRDVPGLENNRRTSGGSYVSDIRRPSPRTPSLHGQYTGHGLTLVPAEHIALPYSAGTPSPLSSGGVGLIKPLDTRLLPANLSAVLKQDPAIPEPTLSTGAKQLRLDESMLNPLQHSNVYIKGLAPETTDELLETWAARFGEVHQTKAIIETTTKQCKGYGFARFITIPEAQYCILAFRHGGYEASFAKESFNALLKQNADEASTNLYLSGLPLYLTSDTLPSFFPGFELASSRVLVDDATGQSRGVGFARFLSRATCEAVIKQFHGQPIGEDGGILQVRYADTPEQKALKYEAATRRQLRPEPLHLRDRTGYLRAADGGPYPRSRLNIGSPHNAPKGPATMPATRSFERVRSLQATTSFDNAPRDPEQSPSERKAANAVNSSPELDDIAEALDSCTGPASKASPVSPSEHKSISESSST